MKRLPKYLIFGVAFAILILVAFTAGSVFLFSPDVNRFSSYSEVQTAGLIDKGWIPNFLPEDAFEIVHRNDLDNSASATEFSYSNSFIPKIKTQLRPVSRQFAEKRKREATKISWSFKNINNAQYFEVQSSDMDAVLVIDEVSRRALYWTSKKDDKQ